MSSSYRSQLGTLAGLLASLLAVSAHADPHKHGTTTPIEHLIVIVGENHTFDNVFGTYEPGHGQHIDNLLSKGIVNVDGTPGPHFGLAQQLIGLDLHTYHVRTATTAAYDHLPQPWTTYAIDQPNGVLDVRFPAEMPNGPFQISKYVPYPEYTGDPVHRFFQMWQDIDGGKNDKFVWVEETIGTGSNGQPPPAGGFNPMEGAISMGFYNMNPFVDASGKSQPGDAPIFKQLADAYAISDNYHQAVMGGTGANFQALVTGSAAFFTDPDKLDGSPAVPYANQIENPDPLGDTNNFYTQDGYGGGSYVNCADDSQPGVAAVVAELRSQHVGQRRCAPGHYYLVNNYNMFWNQTSASTRALGPTSFTLPPQGAPTIADVLTKHGVSWKYYSADRGDDPTRFATNVDGVPLVFHSYCGICDPLTGYINIMKNPSEEAKLQNYGAFLNDVHNGTLPSVSWVRPFEALAGHPADSTTNLYELFIADLIKQVQSNPDLWRSTAIVITTDEGGGYYDSGDVRIADFFGDGTRIPLIVVSPFARKGYVDHVNNDHVSILKFIERNWRVPTVSAMSRDNLPNPRGDDDDHGHGDRGRRDADGPAIGDLMSMFKFGDE